MRGIPAFVLLTLLLSGCNLIFAYEDNPAPDAAVEAGGSDLALDSAADLETPDLPPPDLPSPDLPLPDVHPAFDLGGAGVCAKLWTSPLPSRPVSAIGDKKSALSPAIVAVGDTFYVAYEEDGKVAVRRLRPTLPGAVTKPAQVLTGSGNGDRAPWIVHNSGDNRLAVAWHRNVDVVGTNCNRDLMFRQISLSSTGAMAALTECNMTPPNISYGYGPIHLAYEPSSGGTGAGKYLITSPYHWTGSGCGGHVKFRSTSIPASGTTCATFPTGYTSGLGVEIRYPIVVPSGASTNPHLVVRNKLSAASTNPSGWKISVRQGDVDNTNWNSVAAAPSSSEEDARPERPSLIHDGTMLWLAWIHSSGVVNVMTKMPSAAGVTRAISPPGAASTLYGTDPSLATGSRGTVAAFSALTSTTGSVKDLRLVRLSATSSGGFNQGYTYTVEKSRSLVGGGSSDPREAVVAAGANGFGVAWTEHAATGRTEVYFRWFGCL